MERDFSFGGDILQARFGHTLTPIGKDRAVVFGGAVGDTGTKYVITSDTFVIDFLSKRIKKLENRSSPPSNRAAHASICIENSMYVFGGALGGGELADDGLYELDIHSIVDRALWSIKNCKGKSPGNRYGHVLGYIKPYLIIHGGNIGTESVTDVWVNDILNTFQWRKAQTGQENPPPRVYHSSSICKTGTANGMMVIFGGRGADGQPLNDTWGLRKHKDGRLDWMKAPYRSGAIKPAQRYQHRTMFIGTLLLVIGGRNNNVGESINLDIYDTDSSQWHRLIKIDKFRHICFLTNNTVYIHGGFDQENPTVPTDSMMKIDLQRLFSGEPALFKGLAYEIGHDVINHVPGNRPRKDSLSNNHPQSQQSGRKGNQMQIEYQSNFRRNIQTSRSIRLCPDIVVANYNEEMDVKKISIDELQSQNRKLVEHIGNSMNRDNSSSIISKYFLSSLFLKSVPTLSYPLPKEYLDKMFVALDSTFSNEQTLIRIRAPVKIFGDLHGQVGQLNKFFEAFGAPSDEAPKGDIETTNYLFLGDYIDRGSKNIQTLMMLFSLKLKYPQNIFLLRGSHEDETINRYMGFGDECQAKLKENIDDPQSFFKRANKIFEKLPLAALVDDSILCIHSGIGTTLTSIEEIAAIQRPLRVNHDPSNKVERIVYDVLWSDPCRGKQVNGFPNVEHDYFKTKANLKFSEKRAESFCAQNQLATIVRSGEPIMEGYECKDSIITVFSCSDYGNSGNKCSILTINKNEELIPMILSPTSGRDRWAQGLDRKKPMNQEEANLRHQTTSFTPPK